MANQIDITLTDRPTSRNSEVRRTSRRRQLREKVPKPDDDKTPRKRSGTKNGDAPRAPRRSNVRIEPSGGFRAGRRQRRTSTVDPPNVRTSPRSKRDENDVQKKIEFVTFNQRGLQRARGGNELRVPGFRGRPVRPHTRDLVHEVPDDDRVVVGAADNLEFVELQAEDSPGVLLENNENNNKNSNNKQ